MRRTAAALRPLLLALTGLLAADIRAGDALPPAVWREPFDALPKGWEVRGKPGTPAAVFDVVAPEDGAETTGKVLRMRAESASASLVAALPDVDLKKTPILRWRWRVTRFPEGADGRDAGKDDQAIGVYVSTGGLFSQRSVAYRWETDTPVGEAGTAKYAGGIARVQWFCLQNRTSVTNGAFVIESRNVAEDFQKAYGEVPAKIGLSISCNSQYTKGSATAELDWIEFAPAPPATEPASPPADAPAPSADPPAPTAP